MTILHMGLIALSLGATIYVALGLLDIIRIQRHRKKHARDYVFYVQNVDRIVVRKLTPTECVKMINDSQYWVFLGEL